jgi:hypothetical protein
MRKLEYSKSYKIIYWGCTFDSILELKYALSIQNEYEFLRSMIPIYYDPKTKKPVNNISGNIRRYTPDFLIRHKITGQAFWVEIKPRAFEASEQLRIRTEVADNYIASKGYDWKFIVVYDTDIKLSTEQWIQFNQFRKLRHRTSRSIMFKDTGDRFDVGTPNFYSKAPSQRIIQFVMFGTGDILS